MTRTNLLRLSIAAVAAVSASALAQEPPPVPAMPTPPSTSGQSLESSYYEIFTGGEEPRPGEMVIGGKFTRAARMERAAFLGVGAGGVDAALRSQLDLPKGVGLTISFVEKDSPAEKAGLQQHDILQKLNDQLLVNAPQLATLVRTFKAGDEVTLTIIRKGKPMELKAKLIERDLPPLADAGEPFTFNFAPEPARIQDGVVTMKRLNEANFPGRIWMDQAHKNPRVIRLSPDSSRQISRDDGTHSIQLSQRGDQATLTVKDAAGKTLFDGPYNTAEEKEKLPAELREKVTKMQDGIDFKQESPTTNPSGPKADVLKLRAIESLFGRGSGLQC